MVNIFNLSICGLMNALVCVVLILFANNVLVSVVERRWMLLK